MTFFGRPMSLEGFAFTDAVSGKAVNYYRDRQGTLWMASGPWSMFRVKANIPPYERGREKAPPSR